MKKQFKIPIISFLLMSLLFVFGSVHAQKIDQTFFNQVDELLKENVENGLIKYNKLKSDTRLPKIIDQIANADISGLDKNSIQAFYINAYNLNVIHKVVAQYPLASVLDKKGFFDGDKIKVAKSSITLNQLEKDRLLKKYGDARFHFVLVCGAVGCPPITNFAYTPENLEVQLDQQTRKALNDKIFIKSSVGKAELSQIFKWYASDFGSSRNQIIGFINTYRTDQISTDSKVSYYTYDWTLNDYSHTTGAIDGKITPSNASRYVVSSTIPKGSIEVKIFNNLYTQQTGEPSHLTDRSTFFTTAFSAFYGLSSKFNVGINARYRKVKNNALPSSAFSVFSSDTEINSRSGLTAIGPQIRYAPFASLENFSIQSSFVFPIGNDLAGNAESPYIDWTGPTFTTQFFNDFSIGSKFSLFTEIDLIVEDIGNAEEEHINKISTPATLIFSYIPTNKLTFYALSGYSPFWQADYDYFFQYGVGSKYQINPDFELEFLYTDFTNKFLSESGGRAETINLGIRFNLFN